MTATTAEIIFLIILVLILATPLIQFLTNIHHTLKLPGRIPFFRLAVAADPESAGVRGLGIDALQIGFL
jgi:hypothetical protein